MDKIWKDVSVIPDIETQYLGEEYLCLIDWYGVEVVVPMKFVNNTWYFLDDTSGRNQTGIVLKWRSMPEPEEIEDMELMERTISLQEKSIRSYQVGIAEIHQVLLNTKNMISGATITELESIQMLLHLIYEEIEFGLEIINGTNET